MAYTSGDPVVLAKALSTWVKDNSEFTFKLGIVDGQLMDIAQIGELATMPGKEELFSKLLFLIQSPAQRLATVINATGRDLAVVINQGVEKEKFAAGAAPAASRRASEPTIALQRMPKRHPPRLSRLPRTRRLRLTRLRPASLLSRKMAPLHRLGKLPTRSPPKGNDKFRRMPAGCACLGATETRAVCGSRDRTSVHGEPQAV